MRKEEKEWIERVDAARKRLTDAAIAYATAVQMGAKSAADELHLAAIQYDRALTERR